MNNRNTPCACGSGRKYKRCHGAPDPMMDHDEHVMEKRREQRKAWKKSSPRTLALAALSLSIPLGLHRFR